MAESGALVVPETDIKALKEALSAQQILLQTLYTELDVERESSATAASEALSMILRLQGEKASLKMEASQYKRMAEEKMFHAEEALAIFEDLISQKEMEIASLEFQVQAYRYRLLSMGCNDLGVGENKFPDNLLVQRNDTVLWEKGVNSDIRRLNSLPHIQIKDSDHKKCKNLVKALSDSNPSIIAETADQETNDSEKRSGSSDGGEVHSYWEHIRKLDERVKEILVSKDFGKEKSTICKGGTWSSSLFSQVTVGTSLDRSREGSPTNSGEVIQKEREAIVSSACSSSVQDIFEVPLNTKSRKVSEPQKNECCRLTLEEENRLGKPDSVSEDTLKLPNEDKSGSLKAPLLHTGHDKKPNWRDEKSVDHNVSPLCRPASDGGSEANQELSQRIERLERASNTNTARQEIISEGEAELNLLMDICEQLKEMKCDIRSLKSKESRAPEEPSLDSLQEAMLYFWL